MFDSFEPSKCRVALLSGGTSGEREISLASGKGALKALEAAGFPVTVFDPSDREDLKKLIDGEYDIAFLCLHGRKGEDGAIQGFLEVIDMPYTGSGIWSSALSIDKSKAKLFYRMAEIPTPSSFTLRKGESWDTFEMAQSLGSRCVVKPVTEGSSLGVFIASGADETEKAISAAFQHDDQVLVEQYIEGIELTVAVVGRNDPHALPIIEIIPKSDSYDFESKYAPGGSQHICPARLSDAVTEEIQYLAVRAHKVLECAGASRSDFILDENGTAWILETNTIPGMTETSLLPDAAHAAGMTFPELCELLVKDALFSPSEE